MHSYVYCLAYVHDTGAVIHCYGYQLCQKQWFMVFYSAADSGCLDNVLVVDFVLRHCMRILLCQMLQ